MNVDSAKRDQASSLCRSGIINIRVRPHDRTVKEASEPNNSPQLKTQATPRSRRRFLILSCAAMALGSLASMFVLELGIRIALPHYNPNRQVSYFIAADGTPLGPASRTVIQRTPKGDYDVTITFNELGIRDEKHLSKATESDWINLGDSFTHGSGVKQDERYGDVMAAALETNVYNLAIPTDFRGYEKLRDYGLKNGAVISNLVIGICMENDLMDYDKPVLAVQPSIGFIRSSRRFFKEHSALYLYLSNELQRHQALRGILEKLGIARRVDHPDLFVRNDLSETAIDSCIERIKPLIVGTRHAVFVIIPSRGLWMGDNQDNEKTIHDLFVAKLRKLSPHVVDMRAPMEAGGTPLKAYYFRTDPHWNAEGHRLAGEAAAELIRSLPSTSQP
jgi:hypothetical protein